MHCVERMEEMGKQCNLTLFTAQLLLSDFYAKPSMKLEPFESCHIDYSWDWYAQVWTWWRCKGDGGIYGPVVWAWAAPHHTTEGISAALWLPSGWTSTQSQNMTSISAWAETQTFPPDVFPTGTLFNFSPQSHTLLLFSSIHSTTSSRTCP